MSVFLIRLTLLAAVSLPLVAFAAYPVPGIHQATVLGPDGLAYPAPRPDDSTGVNDRVLGTWILNVDKSQYSPGPKPKSQTRVYEVVKDGLKATVKTVQPDGRTTTIEYTTKYDGLEYPVSGSSTTDAIAMRRLSPFMTEGVLSHAGKTTGITRRVIAVDGKTMTITYEQTVGDQRIINVSVYDKVVK
jgi:hypothetical protein